MSRKTVCENVSDDLHEIIIEADCHRALAEMYAKHKHHRKAWKHFMKHLNKTHKFWRGILELHPKLDDTHQYHYTAATRKVFCTVEDE